MENKSIVLGSSSQQRKQILLSVGLSFQVVSPDVDESFEENLSPESAVVDIAKRKAEAVRQKVAENHWIIAADTGIILGNRLVGKPQNKVVASQNLDKISGATHTVVSGVALYVPNKKIESQAVFTDVKFRKLTVPEKVWYLSTNEWIGVAGGYRIQGRASYFIEEIHGSYSNVQGLPIETVYRMLSESGFDFSFSR